MSRPAAAALLLIVSATLVGASIGWRIGQMFPAIHLAFPLFLVAVSVLVWATALSMRSKR